MQGKPRWFNTQYDLDMWRKEAGEDEYKKALKELYEGSKIWVTTKEGITDKGVEDATHRVIETQLTPDGPVVKCQQELVVDKNARLFSKLHITTEDYEAKTKTVIPLTKVHVPTFQKDLAAAKCVDLADYIEKEALALEEPKEEEIVK